MKLNIFKIYQFISRVKYQLLVSQFGFAIKCKHQPTCSQYWQQQVNKKGWLKGSLMGLKKILSCW